ARRGGRHAWRARDDAPCRHSGGAAADDSRPGTAAGAAAGDTQASRSTATDSPPTVAVAWPSGFRKLTALAQAVLMLSLVACSATAAKKRAQSDVKLSVTTPEQPAASPQPPPAGPTPSVGAREPA